MCKLCFDAYLTSRNSGSQVATLESFWFWLFKLISVFYRGKPEGVLVSVIVTCSSSTITFYKWSGTEMFQTRTRTGQRLTTSFSSSSSVLKVEYKTIFSYAYLNLLMTTNHVFFNPYHNETVSYPKAAPPIRTVRNVNGLAVNGNYVGWCLTDTTSGNVCADSVLRNRHHWNRAVGWKPIRFIISTGVVTDVVNVAEKEGHCAKPPYARTSKT